MTRQRPHCLECGQRLPESDAPAERDGVLIAPWHGLVKRGVAELQVSRRVARMLALLLEAGEHGVDSGGLLRAYQPDPDELKDTSMNALCVELCEKRKALAPMGIAISKAKTLRGVPKVRVMTVLPLAEGRGQLCDMET